MFGYYFQICGTAVTLLKVVVTLLLAAATPTTALVTCDVNCNSGEYAKQSDDLCGWECASCPPGFECSGHGTCDEAVVCGPGEFSVGGASACAACGNGQYSPFEGASECAECGAGFFCDGGATAPEPCVAGTFSNTPGGVSVCDTCAQGEYAAMTGASACVSCPVGHSCNNPSVVPVGCAAGEFQNSTGATACLECPERYSCADPGLDPVLCPAGFFSAAGVASCAICVAGDFCVGGASSPCVPGTYSTSGFSACLSCPEGQFSSSSGATVCELCPAGFECNATGPVASCLDSGSHAAEGSGNCSECAAGRFADGRDGGSDGDNATCELCTAGHFCVDGSRAECSVGQYSSAGQSECFDCPSGLYQPSNASQTCLSCPGGYSCNDPTADPAPCGDGTWSSNGSTVSCSDCPAGYACAGSAVAVPEACTWGTYASPAGQNLCTECPEGFSCRSAAEDPVACDASDYSNAGDAVCHPCPSGYECSGGALGSQCAPGEYSALGDATCSTCGAGRACPSSNNATTFFAAGYPCPPGFVAQTNGDTAVQECVLCPVDFACPTELRDDAVQCADGEYALGGAIECSPCPPGFECASSVLSACSAGTYSLAGNSTCTPCAAGDLCYSTGADPQPCPDGTFSADEAFQVCSPCPPGYTCQGGLLGAPCPDGQIVQAADPASNNFTLVCEDCPAGFGCPVADPAFAYACEEGFYSAAGAVNCTICPGGFYCPNTTIAAPIPCEEFDAVGPDAGLGFVGKRWSLEGSVECYDCPAGYACPEANSTPVVCPRDTFSPFRNTTCWPCPAGQWCWEPNASTAANFSSDCSPGYISLDGETSCSECAVGTYNPSYGQSECLNCTEGRFNQGGGATQCLDCPAGHVCPLGQPPSKCGRGQYNLAGTLGQTACVSCDAGYFCTTGAVSKDPSFDACPRGFYCPIVDDNMQELASAPLYGGRVVKVPCPSGTYGNTTGAGSFAEACRPCPAGYYCLPAAINDTWHDCPRGFFCDEGVGEPVPCPPGKYSMEMNLESEAQCEDCPTGKFCLPGYEPRNCPEGYWCEAGNDVSATIIFGALTDTTAGSCPPGTFSGEYVGLGVTQDAPCLPCPPGSYCPGGLHANWPLPCPAGTYGPNASYAAPEDCPTCPAGKACPFYGKSRADIPCYAGYYCPAGTIFPNTNPCPAGKYSENTNATDDTTCLNCPEFKACLEGTGGARGPPDDEYVYGDATNNLYFGSGWIDCALGYFCPERTEYPTQFACPAGTWSNRSKASCSGLNASGAYNPTCDNPCYECPPGMYCDGSGVDGGSGTPNIVPDGVCDAGYYCPAGSSSPQQEECPAGTWSTLTNLSHSEECWDCTVGHECPNTATTSPTACSPGEFQNLTGTTACTTCHAGYYCEGNGVVNEVPCGVGFYSADGASACTACTAGYYCPSNTTADVAQQICEAGVYCPEGTARRPDFTYDACDPGYYCEAGSSVATQDECPAGTYNPVVGLGQESDCLPCPMGYYCEAASTEPTGLCDPGYYCEEGSSSAQQDACPAGTFNSFYGAGSIDSCGDCPPGYRCELACAAPQDCGEGKVCPLGTAFSATDGCPLGSYGGTGRFNIRNASECLICPAGMSCGSEGLVEPTDLCTAGRYCPEGFYNIINLPCPQGHYCPSGTGIPEPCPPGTFLSSTQADELSDCDKCTAGSYCEGYGNEVVDGDCAPGYYCPTGSEYENQEVVLPGFFTVAGASVMDDCQPGEYQPNYGQSECLECPAGYYCPTLNVAEPTVCPQGYYCEAGSSTTTPCPEGSFGATAQLDSLSLCTPCPAGQYCDGSTPAAPTGDCLEGFFCPTGSVSELGVTVVNADAAFAMALCAADTPVQNRSCPAGNYCPTASEIATPCPPGTYLPIQSGVDAEDCIPCPNGTFCGAQALPVNEGVCDPGFYCHRNVLTARPTNGFYTLVYQGETLSAGGDICPSGSYCPANSVNPTLCPAGKYSSTQGLSDSSVCTVCSPGFFCPPGSSLMDVNLTCPSGRFCPGGTPGEYNVDGVADCPLCPLCPAGTFGAVIGLKDAGECSPCPGGHFCEAGATPAYSGNCSAGTFCPGSAETANGGDSCPRGHFCPEGSAQPTACPPGTYGASSGLEAEEDCTACDDGMYCSERGLIAPSGLCSAGYFCNGSATHPFQYAAPPGKYTGDGASQPEDCLARTFNAFSGQAECLTCPHRYYCPENGMAAPAACPEGYYCANGEITPCPNGTYSTRVNLSSAEECSDCDEGRACTVEGLTAPDANCSAGYFCAAGSLSAVGQTRYCPETAGGVGRGCEEGFYCPEGTRAPVPCPAGLFGEEGHNNLTRAEECALCPAGSACAGIGLRIGQVEECEPGYFCLGGSVTTSPRETFYSTDAWGFVHPDLPDATTALGGGECPLGFFCPRGASLPSVCPPGTLGVQLALESELECGPCPESYYCPGNLTFNISVASAGVVDISELRIDCPAGSYCGINSTEPEPCPAGKYGTKSNVASDASCTACPGGRYCLSGTTNGVNGTGPCASGYYCVGGAATPTPKDGVTGDSCDDGYFCAEGSVEPQPCRGGQYCVGQPNVTLGNCSAGFYCTSASSSPKPIALKNFDGEVVADECWEGFYCPEASISPQACPAGTYNDNRGATSVANCTACPEGFYCPLRGNTSSSAIPCPARFYCPAGTAQPYEHSCPLGHYCPGNNSAPLPCGDGLYQDMPQQLDCKTCPAGYRCSNGTIVPLPCREGRFCEAATADGAPCPAGTFANVTYLEECFECTPGWLCTEPGLVTPDLACPEGHYCPAGGSDVSDNADAVPCPEGTYSNETGLELEKQCLNCPAGMYCDQEGLIAPVGMCDGGHFCEEGSNSATQNACAAGTYCPSGSAVPIECPMGHYCGAQASEPAECSAGFYNSAFGATSVSACQECPVGHYCQVATEYPLPCPLGSYTLTTQNAEYTDCVVCPPGSYCVVSGDETEALPCLEGFFCPGGDSFPLFLCPVGHSCANESAAPVPCAAGSFKPKAGGGSCSLCPQRFFCPEGAVQPHPCPQGHACPQNVSVPNPCPVGTFTNRTDLATIDECDVCPEGHYCPVAGLVHPLPCDAGHYCRRGSSTAAPTDCDATATLDRPGNSSTTFLSNCSGGTCLGGYFCPAGSVVPTGSGPCDVGTYCPRGTAQVLTCAVGDYSPVEGSAECLSCPLGHYCPTSDRAVPCPETTYNPTEGAYDVSQCLACSPGYQCESPAQEQVPCSPGYYCPSGVERTICPARHFCPQSSAAPIECDVEHFCPEGSVAQTVCPPGHYCADDYNNPPATELGSEFPTPCPNGTYSPLPTQVTIGGVLRFGCLTCGGGYYCTEGAAGQTQCMEGFYCPAGSAEPIQCPPAASCPLGSASPILCDAGYYCPAGTGANPIPCPVGSFCPAGSEEPTLCPLGSADADPPLRSSQENTCELCAPGTAGADDARIECLPCEAGHVCSGPGTTTTTPVDEATEFGYVCPPGHYCERMSILETPCSAGTYSAAVGAVSEATCSPCAENHFNHLVGQTVCRQCGGTSHSNASSATCECYGKNRVFQTRSAMCRCISRFEDLTAGGTADGLRDCFPIAIPVSCPEGQIRDTQENCVNITDCAACVYGGTRQPSGMCACNKVQSPTDICGDGTVDCIDNLAKYRLDKWGALHIIIDGEDVNYTDILLAFSNSDVWQLSGRTYCPTTAGVDGSCDLNPIRMDTARMSGAYLMGSNSRLCSIIDQLAPLAPSLVNACGERSRRRRLSVPPTRARGSALMLWDDEEAVALPRHIAAPWLQDVGQEGRHLHRGLAGQCVSVGGQVYAGCDEDCSTLGDGVCDAALRTYSCGWDAGDCGAIASPILCKQVGEGVVFDIPKVIDQYGFRRSPIIPIYDENSTLNTNLDFDYSAFLQLEEDMEFCVTNAAVGETVWDNETLVDDLCLMWEDIGVCRDFAIFPSQLEFVPDAFVETAERMFNESVARCCACGYGNYPLQRRLFAFTFDAPGTYAFTMKYERDSQIVVRVAQEGEECSSSLSILPVRGDTVNSIAATDAQQAADESAAKDPDWITLAAVFEGSQFLIVVFMGVLTVAKLCGLRRQVWEQPEFDEGENPRGDIGQEESQDVLDQRAIGVDHLPPAPQELTADEIDQLMKRLEGLDVLADIGFRQQHKVIDAALSTMQAEADTMRDMLARTIFAGSPLDKKVMLSKQVGAELDGRKINTNRYERTLHDVLEAIDNIEQFLGQGVNFLASTTLDEFLDSFEAGGVDDFDRDEEITGRSMHFSDAMNLIETAVQSIGRCKSLFVAEKGRCMQTQALFDAARYAEILDADGDLSVSIESLFDAAATTDIHRQDLLEKLEPFAGAIKQIHTDATVVSDRFTEANFAAITEDANPAVFASMQKEFVVKYSRLLHDLEKCLQMLHHGVPQIEERIHGCHEKQEALLEDLKTQLNTLKREIKAEQDKIEKKKQDKNRELGGNLAAMAMAMPVMKSLMFQTRFHKAERKKLHDALQADELQQLAAVDRQIAGIAKEQLIDYDANQLAVKRKQGDVLEEVKTLGNQALADTVLASFSADNDKLARLLDIEQHKRHEALHTRLGARKLQAEAQVAKRQDFEVQELSLLQEHEEQIRKLEEENESELLEQEMRLREEQLLQLSAEQQKAARMQSRLAKSLDTSFQHKLNDLQQLHVQECVAFFEIPSSDRQDALAKLKDRMDARARRKEEKVTAEFVPQIQALEAQLAGAATGGALKQLSDTQKLKLTQQKAALVAQLETRIAAAREESEAETAQIMARQLKDDVDFFNAKLSNHSARGRKILANYQQKYHGLMEELQREKDALAATIKAEAEARKESLRSNIEHKKESVAARLRDEHDYDKQSLERQHRQAANELQSKLENSEEDWWWQDSLQDAIRAAKEDADHKGERGSKGGPDALAKQHDIIHSLVGQKKAELRSLDEMLETERVQQLAKIGMESEAELERGKAANAAALATQLAAAKGDPAEEKRIREQMAADASKQEMVQAATRRRKKAALLQRQKDKRNKARAAAEKEISREREALDAALRTRDFDLEMEVLQDAIAAGKIPVEKVAKAIEGALQPRHERETMSLSTRQFERKAQRIADTLAEVTSSKQAALAALLKNFKEEPGKHSDKEQKRRVKALLKRFDEMEQRELQLVNDEMRELEKQEMFNLQIRHDDEIVQGYFRCAPDDMLETFQQDAARRRAAEIKEFKKTMLADKQKRIERVQQQKALQQERLMEMQQAELAHLDEMFEDELQRMKLSLDEKLASRQVQMRADRQRQLEETIRRYEQQQQRQADAGEDVDIEAAVDRIRANFEKDTDRINRALVAEKRRQELAMEAKLMARRARQMRFKQELLLNQMKDMDASGQAQIATIEESTKEVVLEKLNQVNALTKKVKKTLKDRGGAGALRVAAKMNLWAKRSKEKAAAAARGGGSNRRGSMNPDERRKQRLEEQGAHRAQHHTDTTSRTNAEAADRLLQSGGGGGGSKGTQLRKASQGRGKAFKKAFNKKEGSDDPLAALGDLRKVREKLDSIHSLLAAVVAGDSGVGSGSGSPDDGRSGYLDVNELSTATEGVLVEAKADEVDSVVAARVLFAHAIAERCGLNVVGSKQASLAVNKSKPAVRLVLASSLPHNAYSGNAYRNSVHFDLDSRTLYLRLSRFREGSPGELMVFLVHCFAHVLAGGTMTPDSNAVFQGHFHNSLRHCGKLVSAMSRNARDFSAAEQTEVAVSSTTSGAAAAAGGGGGGGGATASSSSSAAAASGDGPVVRTSVASVETLIKRRPASDPRTRVKPPPAKGAMGRRGELAEELDSAEAAYLQDLITVREYSRSMEKLETELKQPEVASDGALFTLLQGRLQELHVKYENAKATAHQARVKADDLLKAYQQCPEDSLLPSKTPGLPSKPTTKMQRALTLAADAMAGLAEYLTPR